MSDSPTIARAKTIIGALTPMKRDCGGLCGAACCAADEDGQGGVYLFPGEDAAPMAAWGHLEDEAFAPMLVCEGACAREARPLACRIFPLTPYRKKDGSLGVRMDARARSMCPLAARGRRALDPAFADAVQRALRTLWEDETQRAFLQRWMALETDFRSFSL